MRLMRVCSLLAPMPVFASAAAAAAAAAVGPATVEIQPEIGTAIGRYMYAKDTRERAGAFNTNSRSGSHLPRPPTRNLHASRTTRSTTGSASKSLFLRYRGGYVPGDAKKAYIDRLFDSVDIDRDGGVSLDELYERVLLMYININRQAMVPPPTRETVTALFRNADTDRSNLLDRDQFRHIMLIIYSRATARVILAKISKVILAPLLAVQTVRMASCSGCWWEEHVVSKVPTEKKYGLLLDPNFWRTVLTVLFVITLSNVVVGAATVVLDALSGVDKRREELDVKPIRA